MRDEAHVRLVDAHAEGDRRDDDDAVLALEPRLVGGPVGVVHPRVIRDRRDALAGQPRGRLVDPAARQAIDDARLARMLAADEGEQLRARIVLVDDRVADVGPVEARHEHARVGERQPFDDLGPREGIGSGGERDARHCRIALVQHRQAEILGPEIVAPLRNAVRLVDREQRDVRAIDELEAARREQPLRRDVEQIELPRRERALDPRATPAPGSDELSAAARTPACVSAATWSCISAISGETTTAVPSRSSAGIW